MTIQLCTTTSANNKMNKSVTVIKTVEIENRQDMDVLNPIFYIANFPDFQDINYMVIPELRRSYFCNITLGTGGKLKISGKVDVLTSYRNQLQQIDSIVSRSSSLGSPMIYDPQIKRNSYNDYEVRYSDRDVLSSNMSYYLIVAG